MENKIDPAIATNNETENMMTDTNNKDIDIVPNNNVITPPDAEYNLDLLDGDEQDIFNSAKDLTDAEIAALPNHLRQEIKNAREKAKVQKTDAVTSTDSSGSPESTDTDTAETDTANAETTTVTEDVTEETKSMDTDDIIRMLTEENRKLSARYSTLQGKYNAEIKNRKFPDKERNCNAGNGDTSDGGELFADETTDNNTDTVLDSPPDANDVNALAEAYGIDVDVARALSGIVAAQTRKLNEQLAEERTYRLDSMFDQALRSKCGGLGLNEIGNHPLFDRYASELISKSGTSAAQDIADAKSRMDLDRAATIVSRVVDEMRRENAWNISGYSMPNSEPGIAKPMISESIAEPAKAEPSAPTVKPSVIPHSSGNAATPLQTSRTEKDIMREYNECEARFRKGDFKAAIRMEQLNKEYTKLLASKS